MTRKKLKITIECEGHPTQVLEANGIAAALLHDGCDKSHHGLQIFICGDMTGEDLFHLRDGVEDDLMEALSKALIRRLPPADLLKAIMEGRV